MLRQVKLCVCLPIPDSGLNAGTGRCLKQRVESGGAGRAPFRRENLPRLEESVLDCLKTVQFA